MRKDLDWWELSAGGCDDLLELGWAITSYMAYGRLIHAFGLRPAEER